MASIHGTKWGNPNLGTGGGVVTWSIAGAGEFLNRFGVASGDSVSGESFLNFDFETVIQNAFASWARNANIRFLQIEDPGGPAGGNPNSDIRIFFGDIPGSTIGIAAYPVHSEGAIAGDMLLDNLSSFNSDQDEFRAVVLHELGHTLGLGHVSANSIMTPFLTATTLQADDRNGIRQIYGDPVGGEAIYKIKIAGTFEMHHAIGKIAVWGNSFGNTVLGTSKGEKIKGLDGDDALDGRGGADLLQGGLDNDTLTGGTGDDTLVGGAHDDVLNGGEGRDKLIGGIDADTLIGGDDLDTADYSSSSAGIVLDLLKIAGGAGDALGDTLSGIERILGSARSDVISGDNADNWIVGLTGSDDISGMGGVDTLKGKGGKDTLNGGAGDDSLEGNSGQDVLDGGDGHDIVRGGLHEDVLTGGNGNDTLRAGPGRDRLEGGAGDDNMRGGSFADTFVFADSHGNDTIEDFYTPSANEVIDLNGVTGFDSFADVVAAARNTGQGVVIDTSVDDSILLLDVRLGQLDAQDFLF